MAARDPIDIKNLDGYGYPELPWSRPRDILQNELPGMETPWFLSTVYPDGRPHSAGIGALWYDGDLYFTSAPDRRKAKNLAQNPACTISVRLTGIDLVFEGEAHRTVDSELLESVTALYRKDGWPAEVKDDALTAPYSAPSAGPPPWHLYQFRFHTVFGLASAEPYGATRWRFAK